MSTDTEKGCSEVMKQDGPGLWFTFHVTSLEARNLISKQYAIRNMRLIATKLRCLKCRNHARDYMNKDPPELSRNLFRWTVDFHNSVNERLGKELWNYHKAYLYYSDPPVAKEGEGCKMVY